MFKFIAFILACLCAFSVSPVLANPLPAPPDFTITSFDINGSGCPSGTAKYTLNAGNTGVTVIFSSFIAEVGPGVAIPQNRKNCQMTFGVHVPGGWTFGITQVDSRGFYQLDSGVTANQHNYYYFQGSSNQATCDAPTVTGAQSGYYNNLCKFALGPTFVRCACGADTVLNINTDVRVENSQNANGRGLLTKDSNDVSFVTIFNFDWQQC